MRQWRLGHLGDGGCYVCFQVMEGISTRVCSEHFTLSVIYANQFGLSIFREECPHTERDRGREECYSYSTR